MRSRGHRRYQQGFTLLEVLLVISIFSIAAAIAAPSISAGLGKVELKSAAKKIAASLNSARNEAIRKRQNYYAQAQEGKVLISSEDMKFKKEITSPSESRLTASDGVIAFFPSGSSSGGIIEISNEGSKTAYAIKVENSGIIKVNAL
ncbi:MAG: GspH/FimT family pseudopilin [Deltaproteobacteria bacterium]|nr:GspH/FimT family pseudopilin [Deltaproteobacteria bacterium]